MTTYIILDYLGQRKATIKADSRKKAHQIYSEGIDWFIEHTFCVTETELKTIKQNLKLTN